MMNTLSGGRIKLSLSAQSNLSRSTERKSSRLIHSSPSKDSAWLLREAHKPALADAIWVLLGPDVLADIPNKTVGMSWTGRGHSFNESHCLADLHTDASQPVD